MTKSKRIKQLEAENAELCRAVIRLASENDKLARVISAMQEEKKRRQTEAWIKEIAEEV